MARLTNTATGVTVNVSDDMVQRMGPGWTEATPDPAAPEPKAPAKKAAPSKK